MLNMTGYGMIEELVDEEADTILILCENPKGPPNYAVVCNGYWTEFEDRRFEGNTRRKCLSDALEEKRKVLKRNVNG